VPDRQHNGQHLESVWNQQHYEGCVMAQWQASHTSIQLREPNRKADTWTMTSAKSLTSIVQCIDKTYFINRLKTTEMPGYVFSRRN